MGNDKYILLLKLFEEHSCHNRTIVRHELTVISLVLFFNNVKNTTYVWIVRFVTWNVDKCDDVLAFLGFFGNQLELHDYDISLKSLVMKIEFF